MGRLSVTCRALRAALATDATWAPFLARLEARFPRGRLAITFVALPGAFGDPRDGDAYSSLSCRDRLAALGSYIARVGCVLRGPLKQGQISRDYDRVIHHLESAFILCATCHPETLRAGFTIHLTLRRGWWQRRKAARTRRTTPLLGEATCTQDTE